MTENLKHFTYFETPTILQKLQFIDNLQWKPNTFYLNNCDEYCRAKIMPIIGEEWSKRDKECLTQNYSIFEKEIISLHNLFIHKFKSGSLGRLVIIKLPQRSVINAHIDQESCVQKFRRFIVPVITYPEVFYEVGDESRELAANEMWEINSELSFSLRNYSHTDSIHISVDWKLEG
jgi:hypothetical protein